MIKRLRFAALGAALVYFFDPENGTPAPQGDRGPARRVPAPAEQAEDQGALAQRADALKQKRDASARGAEAAARRRHAGAQGRVRDLPRRRVEKGKINVNAENGKVVLRGEVESPELIEELVGKTSKVQGVQDVESLLHTPGEQAPAKSS